MPQARNGLIFRVLQSSAELLGLFGHEAERRRALALLCEVATRIGDSEFLRLAAGDLIKGRYFYDIRKLRQPPLHTELFTYLAFDGVFPSPSLRTS